VSAGPSLVDEMARAIEALDDLGGLEPRPSRQLARAALAPVLARLTARIEWLRKMGDEAADSARHTTDEPAATEFLRDARDNYFAAENLRAFVREAGDQK
jgi:hypothetical protein